jgi:hypothetical protein
MGKLVCSTAVIECTFGVAPSVLTVLPENRVTTDGLPAANVLDFAPMVNIAPFGMCESLGNPEVEAATAAAEGVLTPMPCEPVVVGPWAPGAPMSLICEAPALDSLSRCECAWGGIISIVEAGGIRVSLE